MPKITVESHERVVVHRDGALVETLPPGRHRRLRRARYSRVDLRSTLTSVAPQEVLTADGVSVRVTATVQSRVVDPVAYLARTQDPNAVVYLAVQHALREQLSGLEVSAVVREARATVTATLTAAAQTAATPLGITVEAVLIKDVIVPPELRAAYAELVTSRQRAQVQLEQARAETAALRSMANAAKLLDDHPALAQLRMIQAAPYGTKIIFGVGSPPEG